MAKSADFGVDTGGTFTDVVRVSSDGSFTIHKRLSTPTDPSRAILAGMSVLGTQGEHDLVHGTTVATNALLERKGARVALVTTAGFEDLLELRRQNRPLLYAQHIETPRPVVTTTLGVQERLGPQGGVVTQLQAEELQRIEEWARMAPVEAFAVVLLHAYANPEHERLVASAIQRARPDAFMSISHEVLNEFREYERASTTAVNAFVGPVMASYLAKLETESQASRVQVMQSNGGRCELGFAVKQPVQTVLSGPAGGVVGAASVAQELGVRNAITFDMGGTSTDVSLVRGGVSWTPDSLIDGLPIRVPVVDIYTVGAGGGSIAHVDRGGALRVGPQSSGAEPGPAAYDRGGAEPAVTDAHVVLGRLLPDRFLNGGMTLNASAAETALGRLKAELDAESLVDVADGIVRVAQAAMARAIKVISIERGHDPRDFALVSFGGAGGLHACALADELDIPRVIVPLNPGLLSAVGMLAANTIQVRSTAVLRSLRDFEDSRVEVLSSLASLLGSAQSEDDFRSEVDLRYQGQSFELTLPLEPFKSLNQRFERAHESLYGYVSDREVEVVAVRLICEIDAAVAVRGTRPLISEPVDRRRVWFGAWMDAVVVHRKTLCNTLEGPAIVTEYSGTTVVPPGWKVWPTPQGHLMMERV